MSKTKNLTVWGEEYYELSRGQKIGMNLFALVFLTALVFSLSFLTALIANVVVGPVFESLTYWDFYRLSLFLNYYSLGNTLDNLRIKNGLISVLNRVERLDRRIRIL